MLWPGLAIAVTGLAGAVLALGLRRTIHRAEPQPGPPRAFGYQMAWIAVKTRDTARLVELLGLRHARSVSWPQGIETIYNERTAGKRVFVSPPVDGWSFVAGVSLPLPMGGEFDDKCTALVEAVSREFGQAQFYVSHPGLRFYGWMVCAGGCQVRAFACGAEGVVWNRGAVTADERRIGLSLFQLREAREAGDEAFGARVGERDVMALAERWSLDPTTLDARVDAGAGVGYVAPAPAQWRVALATQHAA